MTDPSQQETKKKAKIYCNRCKRNTNHYLIGEHQVSDYDDETDWGESSIFRLWVCAGCEEGTLQDEYSNTAMVDSEGEEISESYFYPRRAREDLAPKVFLKLKPHLKQIYKEAITCYNSGSLLLCTVGLRALLEGVCHDKHIRGKNLRDKIDNLQPLLANKNIVKNLHHFRFTGNQAVHNLESPRPYDAKLAIEVMEDLLNFLYELDYKASRLRASARNRRQPTKRKASQNPVSLLPSPGPTASGADLP